MTSPVEMAADPNFDATILVERIRTLEPINKKAEFATLRSVDSPRKLQRRLLQVEAFYDDGGISTLDFCLLLRITSSVSTAVRILRTRGEPHILLAAIHVIGVHWHKTHGSLNLVLSEAGGVDGLIEIMASLPSRVAEKLLKVMASHRRAEPQDSARTQIIDFIIRAAIPFLNSEPNATAPIRRLAFVVLHTIIIVASTSLLRALLPSIEREITAKTWRRLAIRNPELIAQLIFIQIDVEDSEDKGSSEHWADEGMLGSPELLFPAVLVLSHQDGSGTAFLWKCLTCYTAHIQGGDATYGDIFGPCAGVLAKLAVSGLTAKLLKEMGQGPKGLQFAIELLNVLDIIHNEEEEEWGWEDVSPLVDFSIDQFVGRREEWTLAPQAQASVSSVENPTATKIICALFRKFRATALSLSQPHASLLSALQRLPTEARFSFLKIAYLARFTVDLSSERVAPPPLTVYLLYILGRVHGEDILRRGTDAYGTTFVSNPSIDSESTSTAGTLWDSFELAFTLDDEHRGEAISALLHAAWLGSENELLADKPLPPQFAEALEGVNRDLSSFKHLATRAKTGNGRLAYLKVALTILILARELDFLDGTLGWAVKRFGKDPDVGLELWRWLKDLDSGFSSAMSNPSIEQTVKGDEARLNVGDFSPYFDSAGRVMRTLKALPRLLEDEPGISRWSRYGLLDDYMKLICTVVLGRVEFLSKGFDSRIDHVAARAAVFEDLSSLVLTHGPMGDLSPPVPVAFKSPEIAIPRCLLQVIIPWLDDLGFQREGLQREAWRINAHGIRDQPPTAQSFWPLSVTFPTYRFDGIPWQDSADIINTHFYSHVESWLFRPHSLLLSEATDAFDPYLDNDQFELYVVHYLNFSRTHAEVTQKVERLLVHYGSVSSTPIPGENKDSARWDDHSLLLLAIPRVRDVIKRSRHLLNPIIDGLLPPYSLDSTSRQEIVFDPLHCIPKVPTVDPETILGSSTGQVFRFDVYTYWMKAVLRSNVTLSAGRAERLAVLAVAWMATVLEIPPVQDLEPQGPISYALRYVRLEKAALDSDKGWGTIPPAPARFLKRTLAYLSTSEIKLLVDAITSLPMTSDTRTVSVTLIAVLRQCHKPELLVDLSFYILADTDSSSWHRHTLSKSLLTVLRPSDAQSVMNRFLDFLALRRREQIKLEAQAAKPDGTSAGAPGIESKALLKITTLKAYLELLRSGIEGGVFLGEVLPFIQRMMDISTHPSVIQVIISVLVRMLWVEDTLSASTPVSGSRDDGVWTTLRSFVQKGIRLVSNVPMADEEWDVIRCGKAPMPLLETSHPIATPFLEMSLARIPGSAKERWIEDIIVPLIIGQIGNQTMWLQVAIGREGGSQNEMESIQATYDSTFDAAGCFRQIFDHSTQPPPPSYIDALLPLLERRLRTPLSRLPFETLRKRTETTHKGKDEDTLRYISSVRRLTAHALSDDSAFFKNALSTIVHAIESPILSNDAISGVLGVLKRLGMSLLAPEHMMCSLDPRTRSSPFSLFFCVLEHLYPPEGTQEGMKWHERTRPVLNDFLNAAIQLEKTQSETAPHGGACYWPVIIRLKVFLLPNPFFEPHASAPQKFETYGAALAIIASEVLEFPSSHILSQYFLGFVASDAPGSFTNVLPICRALTSTPRATAEGGELRVVCFQIAIKLIGKFSEEFSQDVKERTSRDELMKVWSEDTDGRIRWMTWCQVDENQPE